MKTRKQKLEAVSTKRECDVLIVGGGINGCGLFRELALQGLDVILATKDDFATGATAAPSRMIHGGLRYLEQAEFRLVKESLAERNYLLSKASHYVKPLPTTIPIFERFAGLVETTKKLLRISKKTGKRGALWVKIGLSLYDLFTRHDRLLPKHFFSSKKHALQKHPLLNPRIVCTATYYDAWVSYPERLCHELTMDVEGSRAHAINYLELKGIDDGKARLKCNVSDLSLQIRPRILVNATGAWIDETNRRLTSPTKYIGGTKGSHIIVDNPALLKALNDEMLLYENPDGRVCLAFGFHDKVLAGSTDIPVESGDDGVCDDSEVEYILNSLRDLLPGIRITHDQIVYRFSGVRPLPRSDADIPGQVSRDHSCRIDEATSEHPFPVFSLVGGKWTTFRAFSEQVCDSILERLKRKRTTSTAQLEIGGGKNLPSLQEEKLNWIIEQPHLSTLPTQRGMQLVDRYGSKSEEVARYIQQGIDRTLPGNSGYSQRELEYIIENEDVVRLEDLLVRRTSIAILGNLNAQLIEDAAKLCASHLGWIAGRQREEIRILTANLKTNNGVVLDEDAVLI